ncbi:hypothetical protein LG197_12540 [Pseudomonas asiatica]|uniref:Uncharacterized protein n=1 Tax=Pseudomonas taiwanensis SJ9 TaxID=1388762 RepID=V7DDD2_9PSED|nr:MULTISPECIES: hypothetical protein [Pseudomonas]ESW40357.1 hypothetical protein O164_06740 [Pseudomonas taiwanensis SJ9]KAF4558963.1 hypothetical protein HBJ16_003427 [Pseudomonas sp. CES]KGK24548.1 hypothetical protein GT93_06700 [Pseudomonas plecoglossicida]MBH3382141.1 hypothetical protein [Pseudomonas asiatica]MCK2123499.1 hypothetical protein [Pseudomonas sp. PNPG3]
MLEQKWRDDDQLHIRTRHQSGVLLLEEIFAYDDLDRLERVDYSGSQLPRNTAGRAMTWQLACQVVGLGKAKTQKCSASKDGEHFSL